MGGGGAGAGFAGPSNTSKSLISDPRNTMKSKTCSEGGISSPGLPKRPSVPYERTVEDGDDVLRSNPRKEFAVQLQQIAEDVYFTLLKRHGGFFCIQAVEFAHVTDVTFAD